MSTEKHSKWCSILSQAPLGVAEYSRLGVGALALFGVPVLACATLFRACSIGTSILKVPRLPAVPAILLPFENLSSPSRYQGFSFLTFLFCSCIEPPWSYLRRTSPFPVRDAMKGGGFLRAILFIFGRALIRISAIFRPLRFPDLKKNSLPLFSIIAAISK